MYFDNAGSKYACKTSLMRSDALRLSLRFRMGFMSLGSTGIASLCWGKNFFFSGNNVAR